MQAASKFALIERAQFTNDKPNEVRTRINGLLEAGEFTLRPIAKFTGYSTSVISQYLADKYEGDVDKIENSVARFYRNWLASNMIVETNVVKEIHGTMMLAWRRKVMAWIIGRYGSGKSKASERFVALNSDFSAYVELTSTTSPTSLLHRIADALNIESQMVGSQDDKLGAIVRSLQRNPRLLVIDEADNLKPRTLAILKDIHGAEASQRCAIVLVGTERLKKVLQDPILGYVRSRIQIKREVGDITFDEAEKIVDFWPHRLEEDELKEGWNWSMKHFGVRSLVTLMARAYDVMQIEGKKKIDSDCLQGAYGWLAD